jgi:integrase
VASIQRRPGGQWRARYRDDVGKEHSRHFARKTDAQRWLDEITTSIVSGQYIDPRAGQTTLRAYAEDWRLAAPHGAATRHRVESELRLHVYPVLGDVPMGKIRHSSVQALISGLALGPRSAGNILDLLSQIFRAAQRDRIVAVDPTDGVRLARHSGKTEAWIPDAAQVVALRAALPARFRGVVDLVVGSGLRQGEVLGLELDHIDFLRGRSVTVAQQLVSLKPVRLAPPKTPESNRVIPLAAGTLQAISAHLAEWPTTPTVLPDHTNPRAPRDREARLLFTSSRRQRVTRGAWSAVWRPAAEKAGFPVGVGLHALRHFYASALIHYGASVKVVQRRMGHSSPNITLATYAHLWPDSDDQTRAAIESALSSFADSPRADGLAQGSDLHG